MKSKVVSYDDKQTATFDWPCEGGEGVEKPLIPTEYWQKRLMRFGHLMVLLLSDPFRKPFSWNNIVSICLMLLGPFSFSK